MLLHKGVEMLRDQYGFPTEQTDAVWLQPADQANPQWSSSLRASAPDLVSGQPEARARILQGPGRRVVLRTRLGKATLSRGR